MGNVPQVEVHANQDSPTDPGFNSVLSESLEEYCTADDFYDGLWANMKYPVFPMENYLVKEVACVPIGDETFTVKVTYNGAKLKYYGLQAGSEDRVKVNQMIVGNRREHIIVCQNMKGDGTHVSTANCRLLKDPLRVEFHLITEGERRAGKTLASMIKNVYINPVLMQLQQRRVKVIANYPSRKSGGGPSAMSEALDEYLTYDNCFDLFVDVLKYPPEVPGVEQSYDLTEMDDGFELVYHEPEKLKQMNLAKDSGLGCRDMSVLVKHDKSAGEIVIVCSIGHELLYTSWVYFHEDPLRVETWQVAEGQRKGGTQEAQVLQEFVNAIINKSEGQTGWYF